MDALCGRAISTCPKEWVPDEIICSRQCPVGAQLNSILFHKQTSQGPLTTLFWEAKTQQQSSQPASQGGGKPSLLHGSDLIVPLLEEPEPLASHPGYMTVCIREHWTKRCCVQSKTTDASSGTRGAGTGRTWARHSRHLSALQDGFVDVSCFFIFFFFLFEGLQQWILWKKTMKRLCQCSQKVPVALGLESTAGCVRSSLPVGTSVLPARLETASESGKALGCFQNEMFPLSKPGFDFS